MHFKKKMTITELARLARVSRGTVDRALNNRGDISPETKRKILKLVKEYNYRPNRLSRALASTKQIRVGMITLPDRNPFVQELKSSAIKAANEFADFGFNLEVKSLRRYDVLEEAELLEDFIRKEFSAIIIEGLDSPLIADCIGKARGAGIPVVTVNTDVASSKRSCFVGQDLFKSGKVAADLLCRFIGGRGDVFVVHGSEEVSAHRARLEGFRDVVGRDFSGVTIAGIEECFDSDDVAYEKLSRRFEAGEDCCGIFVVAAGKAGVAKALRDFGRQKDVSVVGFDLDDLTIGFLDAGIFDSVIFQDPRMQGSVAVRVAFEILFDGMMPQEYIHTDLRVVTKNSL